jgi:beta-1,4-mannooligosaccharide/beta-1,4-mannosyl-N-acetylglucosamine phosphorylase
MVLRIEDIDRYQHFRVATSGDGVHFDVSDEPVILPEDPDAERYEGTIYDPRITHIEDRYILCYAAHSDMGARIGMAETRDFKTFTRMPFGSPVDNRNAAVFPEKIDGRYARLERPLNSKNVGDLWIAFSPDLVHWGDAHCIARTRHHSWDQWKLGAGAVPIRTEKGWLLIYHGACTTAGGAIYRLGVMLLDLENPRRVIARSRAAILAPKEPYERVGDVPNVVFTSGAIVDADGTIRIYYGGADTCMCLATAKLDDLISACFER